MKLEQLSGVAAIARPVGSAPGKSWSEDNRPSRVSLSSIVALCALVLAVVAPSGHANANVLPLGGAVAPDVFTDNYGVGFTTLTSTGLQAFSFGAGGNADQGSIVQNVVKNNTTGLLDFITEFNVTKGVVQDLSVSDFTFAGYSATFPDVGYNNAVCITGVPGCPGGIFVAPANVNATADGSVIEFTFGAAGVTAGSCPTYSLWRQMPLVSFRDRSELSTEAARRSPGLPPQQLR